MEGWCLREGGQCLPEHSCWPFAWQKEVPEGLPVSARGGQFRRENLLQEHPGCIASDTGLGSYYENKRRENRQTKGITGIWLNVVSRKLKKKTYNIKYNSMQDTCIADIHYRPPKIMCRGKGNIYIYIYIYICIYTYFSLGCLVLGVCSFYIRGISMVLKWR